MGREIRWTEYDGERHTYKIENFENVFMLRITIKSGDEFAEKVLKENQNEE